MGGGRETLKKGCFLKTVVKKFFFTLSVERWEIGGKGGFLQKNPFGKLGVPKTFTKKQKNILRNKAKNKKERKKIKPEK